jgi:hypothetical protein
VLANAGALNATTAFKANVRLHSDVLSDFGLFSPILVVTNVEVTTCHFVDARVLPMGRIIVAASLVGDFFFEQEPDRGGLK